MEITKIKDLFMDNLSVVIYGAGQRGVVILRTLQALGVNCIGLVDNDVVKQGMVVNGVSVYSRDFLMHTDENKRILISIANCKDIYDELIQNYDNVLPWELGNMIICLSYLDCEHYGYHELMEIDSYMSPYPDLKHDVSEELAPIESIDFNMDRQREIYEGFLELYKKLKKENIGDVTPRFYEKNTKYGVVDALVLHGMIKKLQPKNIIEVGSGFSSAVMLDTNEYCMDNRIAMHFIEPYSQRLKGLLRKSDHISLDEAYLQDVDINIFQQLQENDILFIDSSHMAKRGSDVNRIIFEILPSLHSGVYIHFHDIFKNFEYPLEWLQNGWAWNECYLLRAFLMNNRDYEIIFFCDMWNEKFEETGLFEEFVGGANLWIRKK